jgi:hypothetical protein
MSFHRKTRDGAQTQTKPTICRRCHERIGTTQIHDVVLTAVTSLPPAISRALWFCDRCLDEIGRSKPHNS